MDLYVTHDVVEALEADVALKASAAAVAELAWHLRQRDTARSLELVARIEPSCRDPVLHARLRLTRAECSLLQYRIDIAKAEAAAIHAALEGPRDDDSREKRLVAGDLALLDAAIANAEGAIQAELASARRARDIYAAAGDRLRAAFADAVQLVSTSKAEPARGRETLAALQSQFGDPALAAWLGYIGGVLEFIAGDFTRSVELLTPGAEAARRSGATEIGLRSALTIAAALSNLGDWDESAKVAEKALDDARALGWPRWAAGALAHLGRLFTYMEQPARAIEVLEEAVGLFAPEPRSRHMAMALFYLGDAHLHAGNPARALERFTASEAIVRGLGIPPETAANLALEARTLARIGRREEALAKALEALETARSCGARLWEAEALRSLAEIHLEELPAQALRHLEEALEVSEGLGGHHEKSQLWVEIARVHERAGDLRAALAAERKARAEQRAEQQRRAANQVIVSRMRHEMASLAQREQEMRRLATTDPLTGIANRRHFLATAEQEVTRAQRYGGPVGLIMGDIDRFKSINDTRGHPAGDAVLTAVARTLASESRPNDVVGRLGGEEFAVLLPGADIDAVMAVAERLRASVEALSVEFDGHRMPITISLGCAAVDKAPADRAAAPIIEALIRSADAALYEAKHAGRNRAIAATLPARV